MYLAFDIIVPSFLGDNLVSMLLKPSYTTQESEKVYIFILFLSQAIAFNILHKNFQKNYFYLKKVRIQTFGNENSENFI